MKLTLTLLFLVGFVAFIAAAPVSEDTDDVPVADPEKENAESEDTAPEEQDASEDSNGDNSEDEPEQSDDSEDEPEEDEDQPETDLAENEQSPAGEDGPIKRGHCKYHKVHKCTGSGYGRRCCWFYRRQCYHCVWKHRCYWHNYCQVSYHIVRHCRRIPYRHCGRYKYGHYYRIRCSTRYRKLCVNSRVPRRHCHRRRVCKRYRYCPRG